MSEVRVENITGETGTDSVNFTKGITVTGIATVANVSVGSSVTAATLFGNGAGLTGVIAGKLLRKSYYTIPRQSISNASFPNDDTAPQITEGTEFFSQAYTPSTANCDLYIFCSAGVRERTNVADDMGMALFISDNTDALRVTTDYNGGDQNVVHGQNSIITHKMASWGVSAKTFSLRAHKANSINYAATGYASEKFGASTHTTLFIIEEIAT
tara:strand:+ start:800 stop:1438 length:639 start_codon:yes stop_codon:yes gene_type:complete